MNKRVLNMLERVFQAEIAGELPYQTRAKLAKELEEFGYLQFARENLGGVIVTGYYLTHSGRLAYCQNCGDSEVPA